jgi:NAD(P)-dependent dehydrogenase (short-subunit alcohol dehydrogenase family)
MAPYHVSKYGMEAITESMRVELQPWGIWVAAVEPGNIDTQIWEKSDKAVKQSRAGLPKEGEKLYSKSLDAMDKVIADSDGAGNPPEKVAKKVFHALTAMRPKPRYLVGGDARGMLSARAVLPVRTYDKVRSRAMGLPKRKSAVK